MKTFTRTTILFIVASLITAVSVMAQSPPADDAKAAELKKSQADMAQREAEMAAKLAQRQAELAQQQVEAVQKQVELAAVMAQNQPRMPAKAAAPAPPSPRSARRLNPFSGRSISLPMWPRNGDVGTVLVIPSAEMTTEELISVTEDLNVMSRILEKNLEKANVAPIGISPLFSNDRMFTELLGMDGSAIQSMYLQGYGILFLMKVDFPLSPPVEVKQEEKTEEKVAEKTDPVWDQTRRSIYEPEAAERQKSDEPKEKYDAEKVLNLKTTLVETLKHATNIRNLKPGESIIITIAGSGDASGVSTHLITHSNIIVANNPDGKPASQLIQGTSLNEIETSILVIRAKKSDIDAFAKGDLDGDGFQQRVQILSCPIFGSAAGQGDAFPFYYKSSR